MTTIQTDLQQAESLEATKRAAFEKWHDFAFPALSLMRHIAGYYAVHNVNDKWKAWEKAWDSAAHQQAVAASSEPVSIDAGIVEASRLLRVWLENPLIKMHMDGIQNRDLTRIIHMWPDKLLEHASTHQPVQAAQQSAERGTADWLIDLLQNIKAHGGAGTDIVSIHDATFGKCRLGSAIYGGGSNIIELMADDDAEPLEPIEECAPSNSVQAKALTDDEILGMAEASFLVVHHNGQYPSYTGDVCIKAETIAFARALLASQPSAQADVAAALAALEANHEWHQMYDDHGGYPDSQLCKQNETAIRALKSSAPTAQPQADGNGEDQS